MFATSLPGWKPSATVTSRPVRPMPASLSMYGVLAYCSKVLPPSDSTAQSAIPSPKMMICFIGFRIL